MAVTDINKLEAVKNDHEDERPEDLASGELITTTGTCKYCHNLVTIRVLPHTSEEDRDKIASAECSCQDSKDAQNTETAVAVLKDKINSRYNLMPENARNALISCLRPVAQGSLDKVTVKVDDSVTIKIYRSAKGLNLKRTTKEDDIMDEWSGE